MTGFTMISIVSVLVMEVTLRRANKSLLRDGQAAGETPIFYPL